MFQKIGESFERFLQNRVLAAQGVSNCPHCKNHWGVVQGETIPYANGRGMFPICSNCFKILDAEKIIEYANRLVDLWVRQSTGSPDSDGDAGMSYDEIRRTVALRIHEMKARQAATSTGS